MTLTQDTLRAVLGIRGSLRTDVHVVEELEGRGEVDEDREKPPIALSCPPPKSILRSHQS